MLSRKWKMVEIVEEKRKRTSSKPTAFEEMDGTLKVNHVQVGMTYNLVYLYFIQHLWKDFLMYVYQGWGPDPLWYLSCTC